MRSPLFLNGSRQFIRGSRGIIMLDITVICVGKLKEKFYMEGAAEYIKRLGAYCRITVTELAEARRSREPSEGETRAALEREGRAILEAVPRGAAIVAMCVEGRQLSSEELAGYLQELAGGGVSKVCFVIGGSDGLAGEVKKAARLRLSMSRMTFPHHLARVMLLEQIYRAFSISAGGKYHK